MDERECLEEKLDFGFAFDSKNFSDRKLHIHIIEELNSSDAESEGEGESKGNDQGEVHSIVELIR